MIEKIFIYLRKWFIWFNGSETKVSKELSQSQHRHITKFNTLMLSHL